MPVSQKRGTIGGHPLRNIECVKSRPPSEVYVTFTTEPVCVCPTLYVLAREWVLCYVRLHDYTHTHTRSRGPS